MKYKLNERYPKSAMNKKTVWSDKTLVEHHIQLTTFKAFASLFWYSMVKCLPRFCTLPSWLLLSQLLLITPLYKTWKRPLFSNIPSPPIGCLSPLLFFPFGAMGTFNKSLYVLILFLVEFIIWYPGNYCQHRCLESLSSLLGVWWLWVSCWACLFTLTWLLELCKGKSILSFLYVKICILLKIQTLPYCFSGALLDNWLTIWLN